MYLLVILILIVPLFYREEGKKDLYHMLSLDAVFFYVILCDFFDAVIAFA